MTRCRPGPADAVDLRGPADEYCAVSHAVRDANGVVRRRNGSVVAPFASIRPVVTECGGLVRNSIVEERAQIGEALHDRSLADRRARVTGSARRLSIGDEVASDP